MKQNEESLNNKTDKEKPRGKSANGDSRKGEINGGKKI